MFSGMFQSGINLDTAALVYSLISFILTLQLSPYEAHVFPISQKNPMTGSNPHNLLNHTMENRDIRQEPVFLNLQNIKCDLVAAV